MWIYIERNKQLLIKSGHQSYTVHRVSVGEWNTVWPFKFNCQFSVSMRLAFMCIFNTVYPWPLACWLMPELLDFQCQEKWQISRTAAFPGPGNLLWISFTRKSRNWRFPTGKQSVRISLLEIYWRFPWGFLWISLLGNPRILADTIESSFRPRAYKLEKSDSKQRINFKFFY